MSNDVDQWLEELGLGALAPVFAENEIAFDYLPDLKDAKALLVALSRAPADGLI